MFGRVFTRAFREGLPASFSVSGDAPSAAEFSGRFFTAGSGKDGNVYSVGRVLTSSDEAMMAAAKRAVVSNLAPGSSASVKDAYALALSSLPQDVQDRELISYMAAHDTAGFGPFSMLMDDKENMEEIVVNSPTSRICVYHSRLGFCRTNLSFRSEQAMRSALNRLIADAERELNSDTPIIDAQLADGSRVHAQLRPYAPGGAAVSIRLNSSNKIDMRKLLSTGTLTSDALAYMWMALDAGLNIMVSGAPASGKTSLLMSLLSFLPRHERVVVVEEDVSELRLDHDLSNFVGLQGRAGSKAELRDQVVNALHIRPDRIILGELRGPEARDVFAAGNLGIPFMATMHSNCDARSLLDRLTSKPMEVERSNVSALDVALFMRKDGASRSLSSAWEYRWATRDAIPAEGTGDIGCAMSQVNFSNLRSSATTLKVVERFADLHLITVQKAAAELRRRSRFLASIDSNASVTEYIRSYGA